MWALLVNTKTLFFRGQEHYMKLFLIFSLFCLATLAGPTKPCERAWQSPAQRAKDLFSFYQSQIKVQHITVDINSTHLKEPEQHHSSLHPPKLSLYPPLKLKLYKGGKVVLKPISSAFKPRGLWEGEMSESYKELAVYRTLQQLGIPTLFKGVTMLHNKADIEDTTRFIWPAEELRFPDFAEPPFVNQLTQGKKKASSAFSAHITDQSLFFNANPLSSHPNSTSTDPPIFMVLKFQEGDVLHLDKATHTNWIMNRVGYVTDQTAQDLKTIKDLFIQYAILPKDFQIILSPDGRVHIFDVEYYEFLGDKSLIPQNEHAGQAAKSLKTQTEKAQMINLYFENLAWPNHIYNLMTQ